MADVFPTIADYLKFANGDLLPMFFATKTKYPVVSDGGIEVLATPLVEGEYPYIASIPMARVREENNGLPNQKPSIATTKCVKRFTDASWRQDNKVARSNPLGSEHAHYVQATTHFMGLMMTQENFMINGDSSATTGDFVGSYDGFLKMAADSNRLFDDEYVPEGATKKYTAILVCTDNVKILAQENGIEVGYIQDVFAPGENGQSLWGKGQEVTAYFGLLNGNTRGVYVIKSANLSDDLVFDKIAENCYVGEMPNLLIVSRAGQNAIRRSRKAYNPLGQPASPVLEIDGVKVIASDFVNDETVVDLG